MSGQAALVKAALWVVDLSKAFNAVDTVIQQHSNDGIIDGLNAADALNRVAMSTLLVTESALLASGGSNNRLMWVKAGEVATRVVNVLIEPIKATKRPRPDEDAYETELKFCKATASSLLGLARATLETGAYLEGSYIELPPEEFATAKRWKAEPSKMPCISTQHYSHCPSPKLIEVPADLEECKMLQAGYQGFADVAATARATSSIVFSANQALYTELKGALVRHHHHHIHGQQPAQVALPEELDLSTLNFIPAPLGNDLVFRKYECNITHMPIRHVVCDPNGRTLYERSAILAWVAVHHNSPVTRLPLQAHQLLQRPAVQRAINERLQFHQHGLEEYLQQRQNVPPAAGLQAAADLEHPTD